MIAEISHTQLTWFTRWIESDDAIPSSALLPKATRWVVVLHPGTRFIADERFPFQLPTDGPAEQPEPSTRQKAAFDRLLLAHLGPDEPWSLAVYAGYLDERRRGVNSGFDEPLGTWHIGRLNYVLFGGAPQDCTFAAVEHRWGHVTFTELSYAWSDSHTWFLATTPDTSVTVIGCNDNLAEALIADPDLRAHEWER